MRMTPTRLEIRNMIDTAALAEVDFPGTLQTIKQKVTDYQNIYEGYRSNILERLERFKDLSPESVLYLFTRSDIVLLLRAWKALNSMLFSLSIKGWALPDTSFSNNQSLQDIGLQYKSIFGTYEDESIANRFGRYSMITSNTQIIPHIHIPVEQYLASKTSFDDVYRYIYRSHDTEVFNPLPMCWYNYIVHTDTRISKYWTRLFDPTTKYIYTDGSSELLFKRIVDPSLNPATPTDVVETNIPIDNAESFFWLPEYSKIVFVEGTLPVYKETCGYYKYDYADDDYHHKYGKRYLRLNVYSADDILAAHKKFGDIYTRDFRPGLYTYDPKFSWYDSLKNNSIITMELSPHKLWKGYWGSGKFGWSSEVDDLMVKKSYRESGWADAAYNLAADAAFLIHNYDTDHKVDITQLFTLLQDKDQCKALFQIGNIWAVRHQIIRIVCTQLMKLYKNGRVGRQS